MTPLTPHWMYSWKSLISEVCVLQVNVRFPDLLAAKMDLVHAGIVLGVPGEVLVSPVKPHPRVNVQH